jgi:hypothetical protein
MALSACGLSVTVELGGGLVLSADVLVPVALVAAVVLDGVGDAPPDFAAELPGAMPLAIGAA